MRTENMSYRADPSAIRESAEWAGQYRGDMRRAVNDNPGGAVLTAFGAGFGIGLAIGLSLVMSEDRRSPMQRRVDRFRHGGDRLRHRADEYGGHLGEKAEELGHRVLESLRDYLPDSVARRM